MRSLVLEHEIYVRLTPVHKRQQTRALFGGLARGLWAGSAAAVLLGLANLALLKWPVHRAYLPWLAEWPHHGAILPAAAITALLLGLLIGVWLGVRRKPDWLAAAAAVDAHYRFQHRTTTALRFLDKPSRKPLEDMQIVDCVQHLGRIDPRAVVPLGAVKPITRTLIFLAAAAGAIAGPLVAQPTPYTPGQPSLEAPAATRPGEAVLPVAAPRITGTFPDDVHWREAPPGQVVANRTNLLTGATLEEVVSAAGRATADPEGSPEDTGTEGSETPRTVLEAELLPVQHRRTIRRYFEAIGRQAGKDGLGTGP